MVEIDEAAAEQYASLHIATVKRYYPLQLRSQSMQTEYNLCRAALAWKARADKWDALIRPESILPLQAAKDWRERAEELQDTLGLAQLAAQTWKHRAEAAEAERDSLRRQLATSVKAR